MIQLTYWEDPPNKKYPDDYDEIRTVHLKTVKQLPELIANRPANCTAISTERSASAKHNGKVIKAANPRYFKFIWEGTRGRKTLCPHCKGTGRI